MNTQPSTSYTQIAAYGLPGLPLAMLGLPLYVYLPTFYVENLGLSLTAVGAALLLARVLDVITDPLVGYLNDRTGSKLGRRKLFMLLGAPFLLMGLEMLLRPMAPVSSSYLLLWSVVTYLGWTLINIPWHAWGAEITHDYHQKSVLAGSREIFAVIGTVLVISLPVLLGIDNDDAKTLDVLATVVWVLLPLSLLPVLLLLADTQKRHATFQLGEVRNILKAHPAIPDLLPAYFVNSLANALPATLFILFVTHVLEAPEKKGILLLCYFLSAIVGLPFWLWLSRATEKSRAWSIALIVAVISFAFVPFLGAGDSGWFMLICIVSGFALGADVALPASIQADIAQQMQHQHNEQTGLLFGLWGLLTKLALALGAGLAFPALDLAGFNAENTTVSSLLALSLLYAAVPVLLKLWVIWRMWRFPFSAIDFHNYWESNHDQTIPHALRPNGRRPQRMQPDES